MQAYSNPKHESEYAGIDYGLGRSNVAENGIRYGVISINSLNLDCIYDGSFDEDYGDPTCPQCGNPAVEYDDDKHGDYPATHPSYRSSCADFACEQCKVYLDSSEVYSEEMLGMSYDRDGYQLNSAFDNTELFVTKSPFYTFAQFCSPCAPGAGNLNHPCDSGPKTYCLGHDWFEDSKAPYRVYRVDDDTEVLADAQSDADEFDDGEF